jgi:hypothetical protein
MAVVHALRIIRLVDAFHLRARGILLAESQGFRTNGVRQPGCLELEPERLLASRDPESSDGTRHGTLRRHLQSRLTCSSLFGGKVG